MNTYIDAQPAASINHDAITNGGKFSIDPEAPKLGLGLGLAQTRSRCSLAPNVNPKPNWRRSSSSAQTSSR